MERKEPTSRSDIDPSSDVAKKDDVTNAPKQHRTRRHNQQENSSSTTPRNSTALSQPNLFSPVRSYLDRANYRINAQEDNISRPTPAFKHPSHKSNYEPCEDAVFNASAEAFQRACDSSHSGFDRRQMPNSKIYQLEYGRLMPPPRDDSGEDGSDSEKTLADSRDRELSEVERTPAVEEDEKTGELSEVMGQLVLQRKTHGDQPSVELNVKLDKDSSPKDIIVSANVSLSTDFRMSKDLWSGEAAKHDLKDVAGKKLQLHLRKIVDNILSEQANTVQRWEL